MRLKKDGTIDRRYLKKGGTECLGFIVILIVIYILLWIFE